MGAARRGAVRVAVVPYTYQSKSHTWGLVSFDCPARGFRKQRRMQEWFGKEIIAVVFDAGWGKCRKA